MRRITRVELYVRLDLTLPKIRLQASVMCPSLDTYQFVVQNVYINICSYYCFVSTTNEVLIKFGTEMFELLYGYFILKLIYGGPEKGRIICSMNV